MTAFGGSLIFFPEALSISSLAGSMPIVPVEDGPYESQGGSTGVLSSPSLVHGWPLQNKKIPDFSSITELIHPAVCNFNMKNCLGYLKMLAIEIQFVEFLLGGFFFFLRLYKQLVSDIPAFKNSARKPSVIWFVCTAKRLFFNPFGVVGFDTPASRTNEKSSGRMCGEAQRHPSPRCIACPGDGGGLKMAEKGTKLLCRFEELHSTPETSTGMEALPYLIQN